MSFKDRTDEENKRLYGKRSTFSRIGDALSGLGAGIQGRGTQFQQAMEADRQRLSLDRQRAAAMDLFKFNNLVKSGAASGDFSGARKLIDQRLQMITELGGDPSDSMRFSHILGGVEQGDGAALQMLMGEADAGLKAAVSGGVIDPDVVGFGADKSRAFAPVKMVNPETGKVELAVVRDNGAGGTTHEFIGAAPEDEYATVFGVRGRMVDGEWVGPGGMDVHGAADLAAQAAGQKRGATGQVDLTMKAITDGWDGIKNINASLLNTAEALDALNSGANTGPVSQYFPSFKEASVRLDNVRNRMGLDVIGGVTFGALSKGELDLALSVALPTGLEEPELRQWLIRKAAAQEKMRDEITDMMIYLSSDPGKTVVDWVRMKRDERQALTDMTLDELKQELDDAGQ
jgi:hypothetical protein